MFNSWCCTSVDSKMVNLQVGGGKLGLSSSIEADLTSLVSQVSETSNGDHDETPGRLACFNSNFQ